MRCAISLQTTIDSVTFGMTGILLLTMCWRLMSGPRHRQDYRACRVCTRRRDASGTGPNPVCDPTNRRGTASAHSGTEMSSGRKAPGGGHVTMIRRWPLPSRHIAGSTVCGDMLLSRVRCQPFGEHVELADLCRNVPRSAVESAAAPAPTASPTTPS